MPEKQDTNLTLLRGNPGNRPVKTGGKSQTGAPRPPANLKGEAFAEWSRVTSFLEKQGKIETIDYAALVVYCSAWAMFNDARQAFDEHGSLVPGRDGGMVKNPAVQIMRDASDTMLKYGAKFGFSPKDRVSLGIAPGGDEEDDPLAAFGN